MKITQFSYRRKKFLIFYVLRLIYDIRMLTKTLSYCHMKALQLQICHNLSTRRIEIMFKMMDNLIMLFCHALKGMAKGMAKGRGKNYSLLMPVALSSRLVPAYNSYSSNRQSIVALKNSMRLLGLRRIFLARSRLPVKT